MRVTGSFSAARAGVVATWLALLPGVVRAQGEPRSTSDWSPAAAAEYLDSRQAWWATWPVAARDHETSCVSCHTGLPYALARPALRAVLGEEARSAPERKLLEDVTKRVESWNEVEPYYPDQTVGLPKTSESLGTEAILNALILSSRDEDEGQLTSETQRALENLWRLQFTRGERAGAWAWLYFDLAPWESEGADYFGAALAAVAVGRAPGAYQNRGEVQERLALLRGYLLADWQSRRAFDRLMLLWASSALSDLLTAQERESVIEDIARLQREDGGWSLTALGEWEGRDGYSSATASDGYATGLIAFVLQESGASAAEEGLGRALSWLTSNQDRATGRWPAWSLNRERDPTSERGLLMSDAATAFAVLALTRSEGSDE